MSPSLPGLCLGGNVFGWTADDRQSFAVLDAARTAGITFLDTADVYSAWAHDGVGGQSETLIGRWLADRRARDDVLLATKVGMLDGFASLRPPTVRAALEASLRRLRTDAVDLLYAHHDDGGDLTEAFAGFDALVKEGKVGMIGISNFRRERLREALDVCAREGLARPQAFQPPYSLMEREFEGDTRPVAAAGDLAVVPYYALANGFLTGKYRAGGPEVDSPRAPVARAYLDDPRGPAVLAALDAVAEAHDAPVAAVALAWLRAQPTVTSPLASARTVEHVRDLAASLSLELTREELGALDAASSTNRASS